MNTIEYYLRLLEIFALTFFPRKRQETWDWSFIKKMTDTQFRHIVTSHWYESIPIVVRKVMRRTLRKRRGYANCTFDGALTRYLIDSYQTGLVTYLYNQAESEEEIVLVLQHVKDLENFMVIKLVKKLFEILERESFLDAKSRLILLEKSKDNPHLQEEYQVILREHQRITASHIEDYVGRIDVY